MGRKSISLEEAIIAVLKRARKPQHWVTIHKRIDDQFDWNVSSDELTATLRKMLETVLVKTVVQARLTPTATRAVRLYSINPLARLAMVAK